MSSTLLDKRHQVFGKGAALFYTEPINIVRGKGVELFDENGRRYVDMYNNVPCVGHCHPHVIDAVNRQMGELNVHSRYLHNEILRYGERLTDIHHDGIESVVFSCTGTEANEVALMMARALTQGVGIVCTDAAYHGNSREVRQLSRPVNNPNVRSIPFPESYRCEDANPCDFFLSELDEQIKNFAADGVPFAGMLVCSLLANEGLPNIPEGFMASATERVHAAGGLMIADEVQSGLGRSGKWWGYEVSGFIPDIVVMGKPIGAGIPLAATASSRELVESFRRSTRYFNTFASSPVQAAAGNAVLDVFEQESLLENVQRVGAQLVAGIEDLTNSHPNVGDVRSHGLFVGIEWVKPKTKEGDSAGANEKVNLLKEKGFLIGSAGAYGNVLKIRPPLVFTESNAAEFLTAFEEVLHT